MERSKAVFDAAVVGLGVVGSATALALAKVGARIIAFDKYPCYSVTGSSRGQSRAFRKAYSEGRLYLPMLQKAYKGWSSLEIEAGESLFDKTGILHVSINGSPMTKGMKQIADSGSVILSPMSTAQVSHAYPSFRIPEGCVTYFEPEAGYLHAEQSVMAMRRIAAERGSQIRYETEVINVIQVKDGVIIRTAEGVYIAKRVVIATGPWLTNFSIGENNTNLGQECHLSLSRQAVTYFDTECDLSKIPTFIVEYDHGKYIYGFPSNADGHLKVAFHERGEAIDRVSNLSNWDLEKDSANLKIIIDNIMPDAIGRAVGGHACIYTNRPDNRFLVGAHPIFERIIIASPCSGHGFKFAISLGEEIAELACGRPGLMPADPPWDWCP